MVNYLHSISISATAFLEIVNVLLSAVAMFTKWAFVIFLTASVNPNSDGVKTMLTMYSNLYEVYYELHRHCITRSSRIVDMDPIPAITLTQSMIANGCLLPLPSSPDQPFLEWIPAMMSTGYYVTDQLIQYLLLNINISIAHRIIILHPTRSITSSPATSSNSTSATSSSPPWTTPRWV